MVFARRSRNGVGDCVVLDNRSVTKNVTVDVPTCMWMDSFFLRDCSTGMAMIVALSRSSSALLLEALFYQGNQNGSIQSAFSHTRACVIVSTVIVIVESFVRLDRVFI